MKDSNTYVNEIQKLLIKGNPIFIRQGQQEERHLSESTHKGAYRTFNKGQPLHDEVTVSSILPVVTVCEMERTRKIAADISMKKLFGLAAPVIANRMALAIFMSIFLFSCGNSSQEGEREERLERENSSESMMGEDGMMQDGMMGKGMKEGMMQDGMMDEEMHQAMMSENMGPEMMEDMTAIRTLLMNHEQIERRVENLNNGVKTWTTSKDPEIAAAIKKHVRQMKERMEEKRPIRQMDPLFRELFEHADKIEMHIEDIEDGLVVTETSEDPQVVKLIQQHANRAVSEFVEKGMQRAMQPTPLPEGYQK